MQEQASQSPAGLFQSTLMAQQPIFGITGLHLCSTLLTRVALRSNNYILAATGTPGAALHVRGFTSPSHVAYYSMPVCTFNGLCD